MELRIGPEVEPGRVRFQIVYGDGDAAQLRDYALVAVDAAAGRWKVDEGGGVEMAATVAGDELCCTFAVEGQILTTRYRRVGDVVLFELESFARDAATESAGGVASWRDLAIQRATLRRQR